MQVLLHHEQFKIPENLARFAVKAGMGGFVKKMGPAVVNFVANRRQRVDPVRSTRGPGLCPCVQHRSSTRAGIIRTCITDAEMLRLHNNSCAGPCFFRSSNPGSAAQRVPELSVLKARKPDLSSWRAVRGGPRRVRSPPHDAVVVGGLGGGELRRLRGHGRHFHHSQHGGRGRQVS